MNTGSSTPKIQEKLSKGWGPLLSSPNIYCGYEVSQDVQISVFHSKIG
jgi:hypothetical protein